VIHHFDHLLLLDRQQWEQLRPDVVLQLGGHLTSKRVTQFLEWCCTSSAGTGDGSRQSALDDTQQQQQQQQQQLTWIMAASSPKRHDQLHLLSHRLQAPLPMLAAALAAQLAADGATLSSGRTQPAARQQQRQQQQLQQQRYSVLLQLLDAEASAAVDAAFAAMPELSEPQVARTLSQMLPPGK
jgi:isochorismate synthase/2-succinyl-5-enolpyruvyl-6-hydroxy-3-cyclohexene-1-carboxylate synthase/2-succinyl-6-hydroxy-2,4-cyclohexadiene-1-carboxylate synthase/O-succinylbenzoate synthase